MKIHTKALLDTCGFACKSLAGEPETGGYAELDARAVFITEDSVERARAAQAGLAPFDPSRLPSLRYGDILISRARPDGQKEGLHIPAGRDAGLVVPVTGSDGFERQIPFTGRHMLSARQQLLAMGPRGRQLNADQRTILEGIQGVFEIVAAKADPAVFSEELIGQAFMPSRVRSEAFRKPSRPQVSRQCCLRRVPGLYLVCPQGHSTSSRCSVRVRRFGRGAARGSRTCWSWRERCAPAVRISARSASRRETSLTLTS